MAAQPRPKLYNLKYKGIPLNGTPLYESLMNNIHHYINDNDIEILVLSAAGPKINNSISMTNRNFTFDADDIKNKFSLKECFLLNFAQKNS